MTYRLAYLPAGEAARHRDELLALCAQAFCGAPWHEPPLGAVRTVDRLLDSAARKDGFNAVVALDTDGALLGFAAGWTDTALTGGEPAFELAELVVAPGHQGRGIGRALHDALLVVGAPGRALLMTLDVPELTDRYEHWGWTVVDRRRPGKEEREYVVMSCGR
ncbi:GNAT family N-acetyltransferase [Streptomyces sp. NBC_01077]|uniref:GNAT family N-acetyltransferase n=1 Tax=Streptomyces sp. NBC_01077 TaxID=2903746 RepID=UPI0038681908|nr:GNAT family N-acetyltransferase [Streptomyces sp. NBC_01077]